MKFSTSKTELQKAFQKLSKATPTRSTLPILGCVLIESSDDKTTLRATDLELTIESEISVSLEDAGSVALPLKQLFDITNELPETRITISVDDRNKVEMQTDTGLYDFMGKPADEFPATPEIDTTRELSVAAETLKSIIDATLFAVSKDDLKPALTGVLFRFGPKSLTAVSTDGHRLVRHERKDFKSENFTGDIIAPRKFLSYLSTQLSTGDITILAGENHLTAKIGQDTIITRTLGERFPDYESVIPGDNENTLKTEKDVILGAIRRVSIFSNRSTRQVALNLSSGKCLITTEDPEMSSKAQEELPAEYDGDDIVIGYNSEYLKDVINHISGKTVFIRLNTPISAALFSSEVEEDSVDNLMLLMPIRLND